MSTDIDATSKNILQNEIAKIETAKPNTTLALTKKVVIVSTKTLGLLGFNILWSACKNIT